MTQGNNLTARPIEAASLSKRMLLGAGIALVLIIIFLTPGDPDPAWGKFWKIRPFIVVTLAGATGGAFNYFMHHLFGYQGGWKKAVAIVLSVIIYIFGLWIGTVLGLAGTLWD